MRIQHNVTALNAYRNLRGNNLNLAKNLEKLSSGYRINRAGDDAAGLAVSEKMRAQITGLDAATKNAQDGISLVQTAEGALTEVHSMLNRMVTLATQSANGTYDNEVDRANLQKEVQSLKSEINRISDSANYNGIKLLDGSLGQKLTKEIPNVTVHGVSGATSVHEQAVPNGASGKMTTFKALTIEKAVKATTTEANVSKISLKYNDESGKEHRIDINIKGVGSGGNPEDATAEITLDGKKVKDINNTAGNNNTLKAALNAEKLAGFVAEELNQIDEFKLLFEAKGITGSGKLSIQARDFDSKAEATELLEGMAIVKDDVNNHLRQESIEIDSVKAAIAKGPRVEVDTTQLKAVGDANVLDNIKKATISVDGEKFAFVNKSLLDDGVALDKLADYGIKAENLIGVEKDNNINEKDVAKMVSKINDSLGKGTSDTLKADLAKADTFNAATTVGVSAASPTTITFASRTVDKGKGLLLQVGETSDDFQKIKVSVNSMSSRGLGINKIDISTQDGASDAINNIKNAINTVSSTRGDLGALQNRLEHTINNLGVMHENITEAESRIRDTDMAKEMMAYAKNNILVQSATAMLAQANQLPQSVLQLLQ